MYAVVVILVVFTLSVCCHSLLVLEQCLCHRLKGDEIVFEWFAFSSTKKQIPLTLDNLEQFEHEVSTRLYNPD